MGHVFADLELANAWRDDLAPMTINAHVDSGALHLCIPQHVATQLHLEILDRRRVTVADDRVMTVDYVGPLKLRFANRQCLVGALVLGNQPLFGAIPMEDMDLVTNPARQTLTVNPASPNIAASVAMGFRTAHL